MQSKAQWVPKQAKTLILAGVAAAANLSTPAMAAALDGTWVKACKYDATYEVYRIERLVFSGQNVTITKEFTTDPTCRSIDAIFMAKASFVIGNASTVIAGASNIDFTMSSVTGLANTDEAVQAFNSLSLCGLTGWQRSRPTGIGGLVCERNLRNPVVGGKSFHVYKLDGDRFFSGDHYRDAAHDGSTPARRPDTLQINEPFVKQP